MNRDVLRYVAGSCFVALVIGLWFSANGLVWLASIAALLLAVWLLGGKHAPPVLLWIIGVSWLTVAGDVLSADLAGISLLEIRFGANQKEAIILTLCALLALAAGMRLGLQWNRRSFGPNAVPVANETPVDLKRAAIAFFVSLVIVKALYFAAEIVPPLRQQIIALAALKYACVFLVAMRVFQTGRGYAWLILVILVDMAIGFGGFFANYKEVIFIVLIALATSRRRLRGATWFFGVLTLALVLWAMLFWTAIKPEYRKWISRESGAQVVTRSFDESLEWIGYRLFEPVDYREAAIRLVGRVGYTQNYAAVLAYIDAGFVSGSTPRYLSAVEHVLMPRVLFPDKAALDDSAVTAALTGMEIAEGTSISVGYIAEAHADFGLPWMFLPILGIGAMLGAAFKYFMTRTAPLIIRQAFAVACLFSAFIFGMDIDKALGGFLTVFIMLALALRFGYPAVAVWLAGASAAPTSGSVARAPVFRSPTSVRPLISDMPKRANVERPSST